MQKSTLRLLAVSGLFTVLLSTTAMASSGTFTNSGTITNLGLLSGGTFSRANGVSGDGSVLVGTASNASPSNNNRAFRWTSGGGMVSLGLLSGGNQSYGTAVSDDGSVVVGGANDETGFLRAFRWTSGDGMVSLGILSGGSQSYGTAVSGDGSVVVGQANDASFETAFRWTSGGGMVSLGLLSGGTFSIANGASGDGSVVVGYADDTSGNNKAFRWTSGGGMVNLGLFSGGNQSYSTAVSSDGSVVVGGADDASGTISAFRWTSGGGMVSLGILSGGSFSQATGVSGDGRVVVGAANDAISGTAFRWTSATGIQNLNTLLTNAGVDLGGINLYEATAVSANGQYIAAYSVDNNQAYLVRYQDATTAGDVDAGITTLADQQAATKNLAEKQTASMIESRVVANEILGINRSINLDNYVFSGAVIGSVVGYVGAQVAAPVEGLSFVGGISYGTQDYENVMQSNSFSLAGAVRYRFMNGMSTLPQNVQPFVEVGGWLTPNSRLTLDRPYANGAGTSTGQGKTSGKSWGQYGRAGLIWDLDNKNTLSGYGEIGQQAMTFDGYNEVSGPSNPFPASVDGGLLRYNVARLGGSVTHNLESLTNTHNTSITASASIARSFDVKSDLTVNVAGIGATTGSDNARSWSEFGLQVNHKLTEKVTIGAGLTGTAAAQPVGNKLHGTLGLNIAF